MTKKGEFRTHLTQKHVRFICFVFVFAVLQTPCLCLAMGTPSTVIEQMEIPQLPTIESEAFPYDMQQGAQSMVSGHFKWDITKAIQTSMHVFFGQLQQSISLMVQLMVLALLGALAMHLQNSFGENGAGKAAFYCSFALIAMVGIRLFVMGAETAKQTSEQIVLLISALAPILLTLLAAGGYVVTASSMHPVLLTAAGVVSTLIHNVFTPLVFLSAALYMTDLLSDGMPLKRMANLCTTIVKWGMGTVLTVFVGVIGLFSAVIPKFDSVSVKTARYAVGNFVPVVGSMLSDSADLVVSSSMVIKNAVGMSGLIGLVAMCGIPVLRLLAQSSMFHMTAALLEPVAHPRITELISILGKSITLLFIMVSTLMVMFVVSLAIVIGTGG